MGNKIITEKDFWMCSAGALPAPLQGSRAGITTEDGDRYITVADTATSSCIDFGCTHYMLLAALIAAAIAVLAALILATGGMALIAIGAVAGLAGAFLMGVVGALICGHQLRGLRSWTNSKPNLILQGANAITGNNTMTCPAGGTITFAPNIHSWSQAIAVAGLKYGTLLVEGAFAGAGVGMLIGFGVALIAPASGLGIVIAVPTLASVGTNVAMMVGMKILSGESNLADEYALGRIHSAEDAGKAFSPEYAAIQRIRSGGPVTLSDIVLFGSDVLLPFLHVKAPTPTVEPPPPPPPSGDAPPSSDAPPSLDDTSTPDDTLPPKEPPPTSEPEDPASGQKGNAYEDTPSQELLDRIGKPSKVKSGDPNFDPRPGEYPYMNPPEMQVVNSENPLDVSKLDPNRTYLWVVDPEGNFIIAPEDQVFPSGRGTVKHGDLTPGPEGATRGEARLGGELHAVKDANGNPTGEWVMDDESSYNFARQDNPGYNSNDENLKAVNDLLQGYGTDTSNIIPSSMSQ